MPGATTHGWPYVVSTDTAISHPTLSQSLATKLESEVGALQRPARRVLTRGSDSIANNTATPFTGGWSALNATADGGNVSPLVMTSGVITIGAAGLYSVWLSVSWASNQVGERRLELLVDGSVAFRTNQSAVGTQTGPVQNLNLTAYYFDVGQTLQAQVLQASGGALNVSGGKWTILRVVAL